MPPLEDCTLLLTACVQPIRDSTDASVAEPKQRERQYIEALRFYLDHHPGFSRIVLAENSGWDLAEIEHAIADHPSADKVQTLSLDCNEFNPAFGKGYGEAVMMREALARSATLRDSPVIAKATGRLKVRNISSVLNNRGRPFRLLCDLRDHRVYDRLGLSWSGHHCETRLVAFTPELHDAYFAPLINGWEGGVFSIESQWYTQVKRLEHEPNVFVRFCIEPDYQGVGGSQGKAYGRGLDRVKRSVRSVGRIVCPGFRF